MSEINKSGIIEDDGILDFTIKDIKGDINYIMFNIVEAVAITISLENQEHVVLFNNPSIAGSHYLPIRVRPINHAGEGFTHGAFVKYKINDNVKILVKGRSGIEFNFWLNFTPDKN